MRIFPLDASAVERIFLMLARLSEGLLGLSTRDTGLLVLLLVASAVVFALLVQKQRKKMFGLRRAVTASAAGKKALAAAASSSSSPSSSSSNDAAASPSSPSSSSSSQQPPAPKVDDKLSFIERVKVMGANALLGSEFGFPCYVFQSILMYRSTRVPFKAQR